jgi:hypothetical protein
VFADAPLRSPGFRIATTMPLVCRHCPVDDDLAATTLTYDAAVDDG